MEGLTVVDNHLKPNRRDGCVSSAKRRIANEVAGRRPRMSGAFIRSPNVAKPTPYCSDEGISFNLEMEDND